MKCIRRIKMMFFLLVTRSIAFINGCVTTEVFQKTTQGQDETTEVRSLDNGQQIGNAGVPPPPLELMQQAIDE